MHRGPKCPIRRGGVPLENQARVNELHNVSSASAFGGALPLAPNMPRLVHDVEFQPSEMCPQNFVIVDETENGSQIIFHPGIAQNLSYPCMDFPEAPHREITSEKCGNNFEGGIASPLIEDSDYIDLLLSLDENPGEPEEKEVSTGRTQGYDGSSSPESCSNYALKFRKATYPSVKGASISGSSHSSNKRKEARKMVKALRGMVPGGDQMNTAAVFDAAVQHLKGLEGKVQKLGLSNFKNFP